MILFPDDIQAVNELLQERAGLDPELVEACSEHIELGQYDVAIFKAFRVLEGRVQHRSGIHGEDVSKTVGKALSEQGPLARKLGLKSKQATNFGNLLRAAFAVFRNPEAHPEEAIIDYGSTECQAVLGFVNLMLTILDREPEEPLQAALKQIRRDIGPEATRRLGQFLNRVHALNWKINRIRSGFSFRARALRVTQEGMPPKRIRTTVFVLKPEAGDPQLTFPPLSWQGVETVEHTSHAERLKALGCVEGWAAANLDLHLRDRNSAETFERLYAIVRDVYDEMQQSLAAGE